MPEPELIVTYLLDRYVPSGMATIEFSELNRMEDEHKDWTLEMVEGSLQVRLVTNA